VEAVGVLSIELCASFVRSMEAHRQELEHRGITLSDVEYEVWNAEPDAFTSEVRVWFFRSGELVDIFEFHLFRDGEQLVTADDIEIWVRENIGTVGV